MESRVAMRRHMLKDSPSVFRPIGRSGVRPPRTYRQASKWICKASLGSGETTSSSSADASRSGPSLKQAGVLSKLLPPPGAQVLLLTTWSVLRSCFWPVILIFAAKDAVSFLIHRMSHRMTNLVAENILGLPISSMTNPWWLHLESGFLEGNWGYQAIIAFFFLICLPLSIVLNSAAMSAVIAVSKLKEETSVKLPTKAAKDVQSNLTSSDLSKGVQNPADLSISKEGIEILSTSSSTPGHVGEKVPGDLSSSSQTARVEKDGAETGPSRTAHQGWQQRVSSMLGFGSEVSSSSSSAASEAASAPQLKGQNKAGSLLSSFRAALSDVFSVLPQVISQLQRVWWVDVLFNVRALPLQALSLLVIPLPWTLPRLLAIQLAVPCAIAEGLSGQAALDRSTVLMQRLGSSAYAWPFISIIVGIRIVDVLRNLLLVSLPPRLWHDVIEVPVVLIALTGFAKLVIIRLQDLLPAAAYQEASAAASAGGSLAPDEEDDDELALGAIVNPTVSM